MIEEFVPGGEWAGAGGDTRSAPLIIVTFGGEDGLSRLVNDGVDDSAVRPFSPLIRDRDSPDSSVGVKVVDEGVEGDDVQFAILGGGEDGNAT